MWYAKQAGTVGGALLLIGLTGCGGGATIDENVDGADPTKTTTTVTAGYVSAIDQIGLPVGVEGGFFDDRNLNVELAQAFPTGVDALNALQSGEVDVVQVGTPAIGAVQEGMDLVLLGNYTGSATQRSIDESMAVVASDEANIEDDDLSTLREKRIGVSIGSINHLYLLGLLEQVGLRPSDVRLVNTGPPDMAVALETGGIDVAVVWDPWPITVTEQVEGARTVLRGGGYIPFIGYIVATREFAEQNADVIGRFLAGRAAVDQWIRRNPGQAAEAATRWLPGTKLEVARKAMRYNVEQLDPRFSACNYLALHTVAGLLAESDAVRPGLDVNEYFMPEPLLGVMERSPQLFEDLPPIPEPARIQPEYRFESQEAARACPGS